MRKVLLFVLLLALIGSSCSDFNKALKASGEGAVALKMATAEKYYAIGAAGSASGATRKQKRKASGGYERALPLLEELTALTRTDTLFERVGYLYAKSYYGIKDYVLAGYYLENFAKTFPTSKYAEECAFLSAMCQYKESPEHELDQSATASAIDQFQLFLSLYPNTALTDSCNTLIDQLRLKLERKEHAGAMQYVKTRNYEPAGIALRNFLKKWPNSRFREEVLYNILLTDHDLTVNSVATRKPKRAEETLRSYQAFEDAFPQSDRLRSAQNLRDDILGKEENYAFDALVASHSQAGGAFGAARQNGADEGIRFYDTFAARFPESRFLPEAHRLREELVRMKQNPSSQQEP